MGLDAECGKCGECCREKYDIDGRIYMTVRYCRYWDAATRLCTIFPDRHRLHPACLTRAQAYEKGVFPKTCPIVSDIPGYSGTVPGIVFDERDIAWIEGGDFETVADFYRYLEENKGLGLVELERVCPSSK